MSADAGALWYEIVTCTKPAAPVTTTAQLKAYLNYLRSVGVHVSAEEERTLIQFLEGGSK